MDNIGELVSSIGNARSALRELENHYYHLDTHAAGICCGQAKVARELITDLLVSMSVYAKEPAADELLRL